MNSRCTRQQRGCLVLETFSVSHGKAYPYLPLLTCLRIIFRLLPRMTSARREKAHRPRAHAGSQPGRYPALSLFPAGHCRADLVPCADGPPDAPAPTLEAIKRVLMRESLNQPLILIFEDLHWLDVRRRPFSLAQRKSGSTARILLLVNYRPEYRHEWGSKTFYPNSGLIPWDRKQAQELLTAVTRRRPGRSTTQAVHSGQDRR